METGQAPKVRAPWITGVHQVRRDDQLVFEPECELVAPAYRDVVWHTRSLRHPPDLGNVRVDAFNRLTINGHRQYYSGTFFVDRTVTICHRYRPDVRRRVELRVRVHEGQVVGVSVFKNQRR